MKLVRFYREGELSSIQISSADETVSEVTNLFFEEQLMEEQIMLEIYSKSSSDVSDVDELRLDFDRIYSKKQLKKKALVNGQKLLDSADYSNDFSIQTILGIKNEQRYLNATFKGYLVLLPRNKAFKKTEEPLLFATLRNDNFYLLNQNAIQGNSSLFKSIRNWIKSVISSKTSSK